MDRARRIALVSLHTSPGASPGSGDVGGMNVVLRHLSAELARLGLDVDVLTRRTDPGQPDAAELAPGVRLRHLTAGPAQVRPKSEHDGFIDEFTAAMAVLGPYDLIHAHHWYSGVAAQGLSQEWDVPLVQTFHSIAASSETPLSEGERPESAARLATEAHLACSADAVLCVSQAERQTVLDRLRADPDQVAVVTPGVDTDQFHPRVSRSVRNVDADEYVLVAARLEPLKGIDLAIDAVAGLVPDLAPRLLICGGATSGCADYPAQLRNWVRRLGIADRVDFLGPCTRDELAALMRDALVFLNPSHSETYGLTALEAAASGVPVLAAASGGLVEVVHNGVTGVTLDSRDPQVWSAALSALLRDRPRMAAMAAVARERAERHTWALMAKRTLDVYRSVARTGARGVSAPGGA